MRIPETTPSSSPGGKGRGSIVLLSGGLDSLVALAETARAGELALALTFDYGQRAASREIEAAARAAAHYGCPHETVALPWLGSLTSTSLVARSRTVPETDAARVDGDEAHARAAAVWVPNRNGLFVAVAACWAESRGLGAIVAGFNAEEAVTFPDNGPDFVEAARALLALSTLSHVEVRAPFARGHDKADIVARGVELGVPWDAFWSCYHGGVRMCGRCESCVRAWRALEAAGLAPVVGARFEGPRPRGSGPASAPPAGA